MTRLLIMFPLILLDTEQAEMEEGERQNERKEKRERGGGGGEVQVVFVFFDNFPHVTLVQIKRVELNWEREAESEWYERWDEDSDERERVWQMERQMKKREVKMERVWEMLYTDYHHVEQLRQEDSEELKAFHGK